MGQCPNHVEKFTLLNQGLSKHQEVSSTPVTKVKKIIVVFWDLLGAKKVNPENICSMWFI